ncbi:MAG: hypothetical protein Q4A84_00615 [Neisseria sp.]|uniref:PilW family protein n=1 Tax=Neisseria sp. TaxID=192066 RepID=UPI0026DC6CC1|nr:hypothetical protein [Neisseria sp.]MDO4640198.1 hypothetical protein [Neisseria sp.]
MKNKKIYFNQYTGKPKGFSIIEFMIASLLSVIVLIAVGSGYFAARKVNDVAIARLNAQQDIRNLSNMIVHDARMAGDFGCFNLSNLGGANIAVENELGQGNSILNLKDFLFSGTAGNTNAIKLSEGVKSIAQSKFSQIVTVNNFTAQSDALVFQYGDGSPAITGLTSNKIEIEPAQDSIAPTLTANAPIAVSTCNTLSLHKVSGRSGNSITLNGALPTSISAKTALPEVSLTRYIVNVYVVGTLNGQQGLYRIQYGNGSWETPQLLLPNITGMTILYGYVKGCPSIDPAAASSADENFNFTNQQLTTDAIRPLASVRLVLNGNNLAARGELMANSASKESAGDVYIYNIDANIRGGNRCANR